jgi:hypothetical protein
MKAAPAPSMKPRAVSPLEGVGGAGGLASHDQPHLFAGPTLHQTRLGPEAVARQGVTLRPPIRRGDIPGLLTEHAGAPGTIVIVDGRFGDVMAVGHREILFAIEAGWTVWGLASMGAIRAAELNSHGVRGYGNAYTYLRDTMAPDDEVAVLHGPAPTYEPVSEALIDIRAFLSELSVRGSLDAEAADRLVADLATTWFGHRTITRLIQAAVELGPGVTGAIEDGLSLLPAIRVKAADLKRFLVEQPWQQ